MFRSMMTRLLPSAAAAVSLAFCAALYAEAKPAEKPAAEAGKEAAALPDYIRFAEDDTGARLEIAVKTFALPGGAKVDLMGVVHIADAAYYADLNKRFDAYDAVLFELVGDPEAVTKKPPVEKTEQKEEKEKEGTGAIHFIQTTAGRLLKLTFQLGQIDYTKPNMVHADTTWEEFQAMQKERGESMAGLFMKAMKAQMSGQLDHLPVKELDTFGLLRILMSKDSAGEFKIVLAKMFDQAESMTSIMEGEDGSAILSGRNEVVLKKLQEVMKDGTKKKLAIFYGAAHMPGIEQMLIKELKAEPAGEQWLPAWTMPRAAESKAAAPAEDKAAEKP